MRTILSIILLLAVNYCYGQFSLSIGASRLRENLFQNGRNVPLFGKNQLHLYNCYTFQADYTKSFFRTYTEFSLLPESFEVTRKRYHQSAGGPWISSSLDKREYHSNLSFGYLTIKGGIGSEFKKNFKKNWWYSFSFNLFVRYERLIYKSESNKVMYKTLTYTNSVTQSNTTTEYPPVYYTQDLIDMTYNMFQFGIELKKRLGIQNYFVEFSLAISRSIDYRTSPINIFSNIPDAEQQNSHWALNTGVKLGYYIGRKAKKDKKNSSD